MRAKKTLITNSIKLKIAVNTRHLTAKGFDGIGRFTFETFKLVAQQHPEVEFLYLFDRKFMPQYITSDNIKPIVVYPPTQHPHLINIWYNLALPIIFKKHKPDLFVSPDGLLSLKTDIKQLAVIHDLNFIHFPDVSSKYADFFLNFYPKSAAKAFRVATVSEYSKQDIINEFKIEPSKIDVVYNGIADAYYPVTETEKKETQLKYTNGCAYFVFVGSFHKRKNIVRLLQAFEKFKSDNASTIKIILAGNRKWSAPDIAGYYEQMKFKDDVIFTNRLSDEELRKVLGSAMALTYVSLFEGFGIPVIEAFNCDVPVLSSNVTAIPEISGGAALLVNPLAVDEIAAAMQKLATEKEYRELLIQNGRIQRQQFTWQRSADSMWHAIEKCF